MHSALCVVVVFHNYSLLRSALSRPLSCSPADSRLPTPPPFAKRCPLPPLFCETRALLSKRGGGSEGGAELHLQERTLEEKRVEFVGEAAVAKIRVQRTLLPSAPSISIRSSPFLSPVAKQGEGEEWQQQGRSGRFRPVCAKKRSPPFFPACSCVVGSVYKRHSSFFLSFEHLFL